jgi:gliding motility-associated-like protein
MNNTGAFITAQSGSFIYVNGSVANGNSGILAVNGNGTATSAELYVTQDVINNSTINADGYIRLLGDWIDNSAFSSATGTVFFEGGNQYLGGSSATQFYNVTLDGTGIKTQQVNKSANGTLDLKSLHLNTDIYGFYVNNPAITSVQRTTGFVSSANSGFLSRKTNTTNAYLYPVGSTANTSANIPGTAAYKYRPVEINPIDNQTNDYAVRFANLDAGNETPVGYDRTIAEPVICEANPNFYHQIYRINGTSDATIDIFFDPVLDGNWSDAARWNVSNPLWQDMSGTSYNASAPLSYMRIANWTNFTDIPYILTKTGGVIPLITTPAGGGCSPQNITLNTPSVNGVSYTWYANGQEIGNGSSLNMNFDNAGCYDITLNTDDGNCSLSATIVDLICVEETPDASFTANPPIIDFWDETIYFSNQSEGADSYSWSFGNTTSSNETNPVVTYEDVDGNQTVILVASTTNGCTDTAIVVIPYEQTPVYYVPNSFTPDNDEHNHTWKPIFTAGFDPYDFSVLIYNRWGELIWESYNATIGWNGSYGPDNLICQDGVYTYKIGFKSPYNDKKYEITGHINLIR